MSVTEVFLDTNILVYLTEIGTPHAEVSERLVADGATISVQVLNEFANVAQLKVGLSWSATRGFIDAFRSSLTIVPITIVTHLRGLEIAERYRLNVYDSMILAAAELAGCRRLLSEDLHEGLAIGTLRVENPYAAS